MLNHLSPPLIFGEKLLKLICCTVYTCYLISDVGAIIDVWLHIQNMYNFLLSGQIGRWCYDCWGFREILYTVCLLEINMDFILHSEYTEQCCMSTKFSEIWLRYQKLWSIHFFFRMADYYVKHLPKHFQKGLAFNLLTPYIPFGTFWYLQHPIYLIEYVGKYGYSLIYLGAWLP